MFSEYFHSDSFEPQVYYTYEEFAGKAHIGGKLLKDIWNDVTNADYMWIVQSLLAESMRVFAILSAYKLLINK